MERSIARNKPLKKGFTTGSCAAAASKAAAIMLFAGEEPGEVSIETPAGAVFTAKIYYVNIKK
ncbi:MAG: cobalt-precorrin-5B (C(1))-methyltransferase, partial [Lachnospiraceae bacterium]|nr:cobalt-precorrin-5B (C(1))-methyltransferase [Lachnospiraceae bacterium]